MIGQGGSAKPYCQEANEAKQTRVKAKPLGKASLNESERCSRKLMVKRVANPAMSQGKKCVNMSFS